MALTIENAGALVPGVKIKEENVDMQKVKVLRTFIGLPEDAKVGSILTISKPLAIQAKDSKKVEFLPEDPVASPVKPPPIPVVESKSEVEGESKPQAKEKPKRF
jgi:hypothetical protein